MRSVNTRPEYIGKRYGRLTVIGFNLETGEKRKWRVRCDCGKEFDTIPWYVKSGDTRSCGCLHIEAIKEANTKHKHPIEENLRLYNIYKGIKKRCYNEKDFTYKNYGARGIKMCKEWLDSYDSFFEWAMSNEYKDDLTIERVDVNGNYCPENCKWITNGEQGLNKRNTIWVNYRGEKIQLVSLCERLGKSYDLVYERIKTYGWGVEPALHTPTYGTETTIKQLAEKRGLKPETVYNRIRRCGWSIEKALGTPVKKTNSVSTKLLICK